MRAINGAVPRIVEELRVQTLVERPVGLQVPLTAYQQMVVVVLYLTFGKALGPEAEFIHIPFEAAQSQPSCRGDGKGRFCQCDAAVYNRVLNVVRTYVACNNSTAACQCLQQGTASGKCRYNP